MASRGFEFAYMIDGSPGVPMVRDWEMAADASGYVKGDILFCDSLARADKAANNQTSFFAVCQETETGSVSADDLLKVAILTRGQVWKCSMDATTTAIKKVYVKNADIVDENTVDADGAGSGGLILFDTGTDDEGNVLAYVTFNITDLHGTS